MNFIPIADLFLLRIWIKKYLLSGNPSYRWIFVQEALVFYKWIFNLYIWF